jgi:hypothetical protein
MVAAGPRVEYARVFPDAGQHVCLSWGEGRALVRVTAHREVRGVWLVTRSQLILYWPPGVLTSTPSATA